MLGEDDASIASLRRAIEVDPRHTPALGNLAVRKFSRGHVAGAERLFRRAQELDPVDAHTNLWMTLILALTGRWDEWDRLIERLRKVADHEFYLRGLLTIRAMALVIRDRHQELVALLEEARNAGMDDANMAMIDAYQAARSGRTDLARRRLAERGDSASLHLGACALAARTALMLGEPGRAVQIFSMTTVAYITPTIARLDHGLHPLLGHAPFAPRVSPHTLVWPLEAPMIDATRHGLFREVRIESGVPDASDILKGL